MKTTFTELRFAKTDKIKDMLKDGTLEVTNRAYGKDKAFSVILDSADSAPEGSKTICAGKLRTLPLKKLRGYYVTSGTYPYNQEAEVFARFS